jgi:polyhydroxyalkanoate synthesis regulator phasin
MVQPLKVYAAEIVDGLGELLSSSNAQVTTALARIMPDIVSPQRVSWSEASDLEVVKTALGESEDSFDLFPIHAILVTTGINKNDDIFDKSETWEARNSPEDKPFNLGHDPAKIIGHITGSVVIDDSDQHNVVAADTELPDKFHILTRSVIYRQLGRRDEALTAEIAELIEGIGRNEWFVSMEALFSGFDYGLVCPDGQPQVIARQESTAFLTKHLRVYGGSGFYDGKRIGRVLRSIAFSGKGLVRNPANTESVIFNDTEVFKGVLASDDEIKLLTSWSSNMSDEILRELKDKNAALEQKLTAATQRLEEMGEAAVQAKLDAKDGTITELKTEIASLTDEVKALKTSAQELETSRDEAVAAKIEVEEELTKAKEKIEKSEAEALKTSRVSVLVDKGVDKAEAEELVASFDDLDDDKFNRLVEMQAELVAAKCAGKKGKDEKDEKSGDSKADKSDDDDSSDDDGEGSDADVDDTLANADEDDDAALASDKDTDDDKKDELSESIANFLEKRRNR